MDLLPTSVIGSYAWPSWFVTAVEAIRRGEYGPADVRETLDDAVDLALRDQEEAGVDIVTDGEMRRLGFFTADFYGRLSGLRALPPERRLGPAGHDQRERYEVIGPILAPHGLGLVGEFEYARRRTARRLKVTCPGPFTLAGRIVPGGMYGRRMDIADALAQILNAEWRALAGAGADVIQIDEPSYAVHPDDPRGFVTLFNAATEGVRARIGLHLCFGNFVGRPVARRTYLPLFPDILEVRADELALEFANRELSEVALGAQVAAAGKVLAAGVVDVKNYHVETPEEIAGRIRAILAHVPPESLVVVPDCGLSQTARWAARAKLRAMVQGTALVRRSL
jgi:5-methyltetrahydropteroyltriglutamate--homocysteine methyltransferase